MLVVLDDIGDSLRVVKSEYTAASLWIVLIRIVKLLLRFLLITLISPIILGNNRILILNLPQNILLLSHGLHMRIPRYTIMGILILALDHFTVTDLLSIVLDGEGVFGLEGIEELVGVVDYVDLDGFLVEYFKGPLSNFLFGGLFG